MINTTQGQVVFIEHGEQLSASIVAALRLASKWVLKAYGLEATDLGRVNTKTNHEAAFPVYVSESILRKGDEAFTDDYVRDALEFVSNVKGGCHQDLYLRLTMADPYGRRGYRRSFYAPLRLGFSAFMVALHMRRAIVLPFSFRWPAGLVKDEERHVIGRREICPRAELPVSGVEPP